MKLQPINLAPKAPDDLPAPAHIRVTSHISPTGALCSREIELLLVSQTHMLLHAFVPSYGMCYAI